MAVTISILPPPQNATVVEDFTNDDAAWALTCAFLILTMQTGFAMLECGCVSTKNVTNIMVKNVVDVSIGGICYWMIGYALSFGTPSNSFCGYGSFFFTVDSKSQFMGTEYARYFFQFSFATTATTIVSGAVAERMQLKAYMLFAFFNVIIYAIPASWAWNPTNQERAGGWLYQIGYFDFAGVSIVHLTGGVSSLVAAVMLGPRHGRFEEPENFEMSSPVTSLTGMFMLWWAWLGFNCGSTFGVSGHLWKVAALVAVTTLNAGIGGGLAGLLLSMLTRKGKIHIPYVIDSTLGGLVAVTGIASVVLPNEAVLIGAIGGAIAVAVDMLCRRFHIDDPVGAVAVHMGGSVWGTLAIGVFGRENQTGQLRGLNGLIHSGSFRLLGVQFLGMIVIGLWSAVMTFLLLSLIGLAVGLRMSEEDEILGADWVVHGIHSQTLSKQLEKALLELPLQDWKELMVRLSRELHSTKTVAVDTKHRIYSADVHKNSNQHAAAMRAIQHKHNSQDNPKNGNLVKSESLLDVLRNKGSMKRIHDAFRPRKRWTNSNADTPDSQMNGNANGTISTAADTPVKCFNLPNVPQEYP